MSHSHPGDSQPWFVAFHDTPIIDLYVLLTKSHKERRDEGESGFIFTGAQGRAPGVKAARACRRREEMDPYWWGINGQELSTIGERAPRGSDSKTCWVRSGEGPTCAVGQKYIQVYGIRKGGLHTSYGEISFTGSIFLRNPIWPHKSTDYEAMRAQSLQSSWKSMLMGGQKRNCRNNIQAPTPSSPNNKWQYCLWQ